MTDYRERAIKDVAEAMGVDIDDVLFYMRPDASSGKLATYAVAQREARLRLEEVLENLSEAVFNRGIDDPAIAKAYNLARAALDPVKEG